MQQHPVPQNVTQYKFRLVGDMTLKQFLELAGGLLVAYLFFASNLLFFIKWPLSIGSLLLGIGLAFFPIEERPLDVWIVNFIKAIYSPTQFVWKKTTKLPSIFTFQAQDTLDLITSTKTVKAPTTQTSTPPNPKTKVVHKTASPKPLHKTQKSHPPQPIKAKSTKSEGVVYQKSSQPKQASPPSTTTQITTTPTPPPTPKVDSPPPPPPPKPLETTHLPASPKKPNLIVGIVLDTTGKIVANAIVEIVNSDGVTARAIKTNSIGQFYISTPLSPDTYTLEVEASNLLFTKQSIVVDNQIISPIILRASS